MDTLIKKLKFKQVSVGFEGRQVLQNCDFDFPMNQVCRIVFANDREKYFFYHAVTQIAGFSSGEFLINDENVLDFTFEEFAKFRTKIGFGFSTRGLIHNLTLRQNLELPMRYHHFCNPGQVRSWVEHCAEYFTMNAELDKRPAETTATAQKATLILRAFVHKPELIFLDSPEMLLSTKLQANLLQLVDDHRSSYNLQHLFFSTYDEELSDCLADLNIILKKKKLNLVKTHGLREVS